jgi:signal transduction histidine kinase
MTNHNQFEASNYRPIGPPFSNVELLRNQLLPIVAHELRQPLNAILFALEPQNQFDDEITAEEAHELCRRSALSMSQIIDNVLNTYCDANGRLHLHLAPVDLASIVYNSIETTRSSIHSRGHRISVSLPADPVFFVADPLRLKQILTNLLTNSAKYTSPGGHIYLSADHSNEVVTIRVRDNGRGINPELLPHIFDPCRRQVESRSGGLGLGLPLVKTLVELHRGNVVAQSSGLNMGSEFIINLPILSPDVGAAITDLSRPESNGIFYCAAASPTDAKMSAIPSSNR